MPEEIIPNLYQLKLPIPDNPLGTVNAYAVTSADGVRLIDCGWNTPETYDALVQELSGIGAKIADLREILLTHIHPDHFGLAGRLVQESGARTLMHRMDAVHLSTRYEDTTDLVEEMETWLRANGAPEPSVEPLAEGSLGMVVRVGPRRPDVLLDGGELLDWGRFRFEVVWTPGHSAGLICLYEPNEQVFISSDHVLEHISPHIGMHAQSLGNPLGDYINSLREGRDLPVRVVLPGHGTPFNDLAKRVDELLGHHERRFRQMLAVLQEHEATAYDVASQLSWAGMADGWNRLPPYQQRMALIETVAHLEYLYGRSRVTKHTRNGLFYYRAAEPAD